MADAPFEFDLEALERLPESERAQRLAELAAFRRHVDENPLWGFLPHRGDGVSNLGQHEFLSITQPIGAMVGGNRSGKTYAGLADDVIQCCPVEMIPPWLRRYKRVHADEFHGRIVAVDEKQMISTTFPTLRRLMPKRLLWKGSWDKAYNTRTGILQLETGGWFDMKTHSMEVDAFAGPAMHHIHFDEEPPGAHGEQIYNECLTRTIDYDGEVRFTLTPLLGLGWLYYELNDNGMPRSTDECHVVVVDMEDNPHINRSAQARVLAKFSEAERTARKSGRFVHFAGSIYPMFSEHTHVGPVEIPRASIEAKPQVPIYMALDPGLEHPTGMVWAFVDHEDVLSVFEAIKIQGTVGDVVKVISQVEERLNIKPRWRVIDPSARNRHHASGQSLQQVYAEHGVHTIPAQNSREAGFARVQQRLETNRLMIGSHLAEMIEEFRDYRWKQRRGMSDDAGPQEPIKIKDDLLDALRYLVMSTPHAPVRTEPEERLDNANRAFRAHIRRLRTNKPKIGGVL